jgi:hypothetical protein
MNWLAAARIHGTAQKSYLLPSRTRSKVLQNLVSAEYLKGHNRAGNFEKMRALTLHRLENFTSYHLQARPDQQIYEADLSDEVEGRRGTPKPTRLMSSSICSLGKTRKARNPSST